MTEDISKNNNASRRHFMKATSAALGGAMLYQLPVEASAFVSGGDTLKVALIGCGKRGAGAAVQALSADENVKLVAMADAFRDRLDETYDNLKKIDNVKGKVEVPEEHKFVGFEAYKNAIALADVVLLATPPAFRPLHFEEAINAGKHVFMEKPLASDAPGIRKILAAGKEAKKKNLSVVVGLQNRYDPVYQEFVGRLKDGALGDIISSTCYYMIGHVNLVPREAGQTEMEYQMRNWRYFCWLWAGSPAGLQIHNTDIVNWVKDAYPINAQGMGGRAVYHGPEKGDIFDHFYIEYEYADGSKLHSQIRTIDGTYNKGGSFFQGTKGSGDVEKGLVDMKGKSLWRTRGLKEINPYQQEHDEFFAAIRKGTPINDTEWAAKSSMMTIMGRMAAHSGQMIQWDEALQSDLSILPERFAWDADPPVLPGPDGLYPIPVPGQTKVL
ncbi:Gfo/Idh/MocA family oxidoreductase [Catalinimonas sp. 4WD22]|uniref:Gfo/Idh/MocA family protein n=1 Tax=Catalinimonas locisalis TaxID=3133978 RepID=UPI003100EBC2